MWDGAHVQQALSIMGSSVLLFGSMCLPDHVTVTHVFVGNLFPHTYFLHWNGLSLWVWDTGIRICQMTAIPLFPSLLFLIAPHMLFSLTIPEHGIATLRKLLSVALACCWK